MEQVICEKVKDSDIAVLDKKKYLVPKVCFPVRLLLLSVAWVFEGRDGCDTMLECYDYSDGVIG